MADEMNGPVQIRICRLIGVREMTAMIRAKVLAQHRNFARVFTFENGRAVVRHAIAYVAIHFFAGVRSLAFDRRASGVGLNGEHLTWHHSHNFLRDRNVQGKIR